MTVYFSIITSVLIFFINFMKVRYHDPRPFWISDNIQAFSCSSEFGNPSGHTMGIFWAAMLFAIDYVS